ncbi:MAG TPA: LLM class flavin-dependent oxidoreductase, partial [Myxococcota bacterium]|nr:LLM class flavin-dependent oxidoreductase [Myxococcota bacterium]
MRVALRLHGGLPAAACVEQARAAERAGFSTVWFAENPFNRGVLPAMTACALATTTIRIGIGVFNPFNRHPTLVAMEMGALDELSG